MTRRRKGEPKLMYCPEKTIPHTKKPSKAVQLFAPEIEKDQRVLDFGAGNLRNTNFLLERGLNVTPLDTAEVVKKWDGKFPKYTNPNTQYDWVFLNFVLNVLPQPERDVVFAKAYGATKRKGHLIVEVRSERDVARNIKNPTPYKDGVITSKGTFQKGFNEKQLSNYLKNMGVEFKVFKMGDSLVANIFKE